MISYNNSARNYQENPKFYSKSLNNLNLTDVANQRPVFLNPTSKDLLGVVSNESRFNSMQMQSSKDYVAWSSSTYNLPCISRLFADSKTNTFLLVCGMGSKVTIYFVRNTSVMLSEEYNLDQYYIDNIVAIDHFSSSTNVLGAGTVIIVADTGSKTNQKQTLYLLCNPRYQALEVDVRNYTVASALIQIRGLETDSFEILTV